MHRGRLRTGRAFLAVLNGRAFIRRMNVTLCTWARASGECVLAGSPPAWTLKCRSWCWRRSEAGAGVPAWDGHDRHEAGVNRPRENRAQPLSSRSQAGQCVPSCRECGARRACICVQLTRNRKFQVFPVYITLRLRLVVFVVVTGYLVSA